MFLHPALLQQDFFGKAGDMFLNYMEWIQQACGAVFSHRSSLRQVLFRVVWDMSPKASSLKHESWHEEFPDVIITSENVSSENGMWSHGHQHANNISQEAQSERYSYSKSALNVGCDHIGYVQPTLKGKLPVQWNTIFTTQKHLSNIRCKPLMGILILVA